MERADMIATATRYLDALVSHVGEGLPLADDCRRVERGRNTGNSGNAIRAQLATEIMHGITGYREVRWFVDGDNAIALYKLDAYGMEVEIAERFLVRDGEIHEIEAIFDRHQFYGLPVTETGQALVGVVHRAAVQEALGERADRALLRFGGIIGGEELRTSSMWERTFRRLLFLCPNILLSFIAIQIISLYEPIIARFTALAVFLPLVANLSGASGNMRGTPPSCSIAPDAP